MKARFSGCCGDEPETLHWSGKAEPRKGDQCGPCFLLKVQLRKSNDNPGERQKDNQLILLSRLLQDYILLELCGNCASKCTRICLEISWNLL